MEAIAERKPCPRCVGRSRLELAETERLTATLGLLAQCSRTITDRQMAELVAFVESLPESPEARRAQANLHDVLDLLVVAGMAA